LKAQSPISIVAKNSYIIVTISFHGLFCQFVSYFLFPISDADLLVPRNYLCIDYRGNPGFSTVKSRRSQKCHAHKNDAD